MMTMSRLRDFLQFAIDSERKAHELYTFYSTVVESRSSRELLVSMATVERGHEEKLAALMTDEIVVPELDNTVEDLHVADFVVKGDLTDQSTVQDVYAYSIKAEQKAYELYSSLGNLEHDPRVKKLFLVLAVEEKQHKLELESEYERVFVREN